jgi:hypothetical protein
VTTGMRECRASISPRWLGREGSRCWAITIGAGNGVGRVATSIESASIPPADDPITISCGSDDSLDMTRLTFHE